MQSGFSPSPFWKSLTSFQHQVIQSLVYSSIFLGKKKTSTNKFACLSKTLYTQKSSSTFQNWTRIQTVWGKIKISPSGKLFLLIAICKSCSFYFYGRPSEFLIKQNSNCFSFSEKRMQKSFMNFNEMLHISFHHRKFFSGKNYVVFLKHLLQTTNRPLRLAKFLLLKRLPFRAILDKRSS